MIFILIIIIIILFIYKIINNIDNFENVDYSLELIKFQHNFFNENKVKDFRFIIIKDVFKKCIERYKKNKNIYQLRQCAFYNKYNKELQKYELKNDSEYRYLKNQVENNRTYFGKKRKNSNLPVNTLELDIYKELLNKYEKKNKIKKDARPGEKCIFDRLGNSNCNKNSICLPISDLDNNELFQDGICSAGEDGVSEPSHVNGMKHYYPANSKGCNSNYFKTNKISFKSNKVEIGYDKNRDTVCSPNYICRQNKCSSIPSKIESQFIPKNKSVNRINFIKPITNKNSIECPKNHHIFYDNYAQYCKDKDDPSKICRLEKKGDKDIPLCDTWPCPPHYINTKGICEDKFGNKCSLEYNDNEQYSLCTGQNIFMPIKNKDIIRNQIAEYYDIEADMCQQKCVDHNQCDGFTMEQNVSKPYCQLKKIKYDEKSVKKNNKKILNVKIPLHYNIELDQNIENEDHILKTDESNLTNTPSRCANECDKIDKCHGFTYNTKNLKCKMYSDLSSKKPSNKSVLFSKQIIGGNLCNSLNYKQLNNNINTEIKNINSNFKYDLLKFNLNNKIDKNEIKKNETKKYNKFLINKIFSSLFIWDNINIKCKRLIIYNIDNLELYIKEIIIYAKKDNKIIDISDNIENEINYSNLENINIELDNEYEIVKFFILFDNDNKFSIKLDFFDKNDNIIWCKTDSNLSIKQTNLKNKINNKQNIKLDNKKLHKIDYSIHFGFYYNKMLYLFRKVNIFNKKVILLSVLNSTNYKIIYRPIIADLQFPKISKYAESIKSVLYLGNGDIVFITNKYYIRYNIKKNILYKNNKKKIQDNWFNLNSNFKSKIKNSVYKDTNICILFDKINYIEYNIDLIENNLNKSFIARGLITDLIPNIKLKTCNCILYNYDKKEWLVCSGNSIYTYKNNIKINNTIGIEITNNIWKLKY